MHELSICEGLLTMIEEEARKNSFGKVKKVVLSIGALSGVEVESLRFCFDIVTKNSMAEGAELEILEDRVQAFCDVCEREWEITQRFETCPSCAGFLRILRGGRDLKMVQMEVC